MLRTLTRLGLGKGLLGGSRGWLYVGGVAGLFRLLGRMASRQPETVYCEDLQVGETLVIRHLPRDQQ